MFYALFHRNRFGFSKRKAIFSKEIIDEIHRRRRYASKIIFTPFPPTQDRDTLLYTYAGACNILFFSWKMKLTMPVKKRSLVRNRHHLRGAQRRWFMIFYRRVTNHYLYQDVFICTGFFLFFSFFFLTILYTECSKRRFTFFDFTFFFFFYFHPHSEIDTPDAVPELTGGVKRGLTITHSIKMLI